MESIVRLPEMRRASLLKLLQAKRFHSIAELKRSTGATHATLHRDLSSLERAGLIRKTYGGVEVLSAEDSIRNYEKRIKSHSALKAAIADAALRYVSRGDHIFLDASSTCYFLGKALFKRNIEGVTIVTNSLHLLTEYRRSDTEVGLVSTGGTIDKELNAFLGDFTTGFISRISVAKTFISAAGCTIEHGISSASDVVLGAIKAAMAAGRERYCLIDSSKFGREYVFKFAELRAFHALISDSKLPNRVVSAFAKSGVSLISAKG